MVSSAIAGGRKRARDVDRDSMSSAGRAAIAVVDGERVI
jgi:hypothetical protein